MKALSILLITIASIQGALSAHGGHHPTGSEIRRLRKHSSRSAIGKFLKGVEQEKSYHVFIGIPSASQVTAIINFVRRYRHPEIFRAKIVQLPLSGMPFLILLFIPAQERRAAIRESWGKLISDSSGGYSSEVIMRFFVHEDCGTRGLCEEAEAGFGDVVYTRDGDDQLEYLAEGQEGVTQRVCHAPPAYILLCPCESACCTCGSKAMLSIECLLCFAVTMCSHCRSSLSETWLQTQCKPASFIACLAI